MVTLSTEPFAEALAFLPFRCFIRSSFIISITRNEEPKTFVYFIRPALPAAFVKSHDSPSLLHAGSQRPNHHDRERTPMAEVADLFEIL